MAYSTVWWWSRVTGSRLPTRQSGFPEIPLSCSRVDCLEVAFCISFTTVTPKLMERTERVTAAPWAGKSVRQMVAALEDSALDIAGVKETAKMCVFGIGQEKLLAVDKEP